MRIRSIKPEFWRSEDIAALDWPTRLLFIGLWSYVDDNGVGRDIEKAIAADLFALEDDPRETLATVSRGLQRLAAGGQIARYTVEDKPFLYVTAWERHQKIDRPSKHRYPLPTCGNAVPRDSLAAPSRETRDSLAAGAVEQGSRGAGEETDLFTGADAPMNEPAPTRRADDGFDAFWAAYPRKQGKGEARKAWTQKRCAPRWQHIADAAARYRDDPNREPQYTKLPAGWLREERWDDDALPARADTSRGGAEQARINDIFGSAMQRAIEADAADALALEAVPNGHLRALPGGSW